MLVDEVVELTLEDEEVKVELDDDDEEDMTEEEMAVELETAEEDELGAAVDSVLLNSGLRAAVVVGPTLSDVAIARVSSASTAVAEADGSKEEVGSGQGGRQQAECPSDRQG